MLLSFLSILPMFLILYFHCKERYTLSSTGGFLTHLPGAMGEPGGGISNAIIGSAQLIVIAAVISIPFGILAGIYLSEYRKGKVRPYLARLSLEILQGIPSIVIGIIAYRLGGRAHGCFFGPFRGIALGIMMLPVIVMSTEETLKLIPDYSERSVSRPWGPLSPDHSEGGSAGGPERHSDGHHPGHCEDSRRDGASPLHRLRQPLHEPQHIQAGQLPSAPRLQLRHEPLPGVARPCMGRLLRPARLYSVLQSICENGDQEMEGTVLKIEDFGAGFEENEVVKAHQPLHRAKQDNGHHGAIGLRQDDAHPLHQPDARADSRRHGLGQRSSSTAITSTRWTPSSCGGRSAWSSKGRTPSPP